MNLYFLRYNNYFNRQVKIENTLEDYLDHQVGEVLGCKNWNPNDGVDTEQVLNYVGDAPDYMVVGDNDGNLNSRWFVIDANRTRNGQYKVTLRRDLVAEHYSAIMNATSYVEKGFIDPDDSAIFNPENISVNQIKKSQTNLYDRSGCPWIVGFIKPDIQQNTHIHIPLSFSNPTVDYSVEWAEDLPVFHGSTVNKFNKRDYIWYVGRKGTESLSWRGATVPNCVGYANGVWCTYNKYNQPGGSATFPFDFAGNANEFYTKCQTIMNYSAEDIDTILEYPEFIEHGDLICFGGGAGGYGHVAIVEQINLADADPYIMTSNSAYGGSMYYQQKLYFSDRLTWNSSYYCQGIIKLPSAWRAEASDIFYQFNDIYSFSQYVKGDSWRLKYFTGTAYGGESKCMVIDTVSPPATSTYSSYKCKLPSTAVSVDAYTSDVSGGSASDIHFESLRFPEDYGYGDPEADVASYVFSQLNYLNNVQPMDTTVDPSIINKNIADFNGKRIYEQQTGKYYSITYGIKETIYDRYALQPTGDPKDLYSAMRGVFLNCLSMGMLTGEVSENSFGIVEATDVYGATLTEINVFNGQTFLHPTSLKDAPYSMFYFPMGNIKARATSASAPRYTMTKEKALAIARALSEGLSSNLIDLTVMPYCPVQSQLRWKEGEGYYLLDDILSKDYVTTSNGTVTEACIYFAETSEFNVNLTYSTSIAKSEYKVSDITTKYRLCSSNNANYFEFSPAKNHNISNFTAHCTYKPFTPYVRIEPDFKYLYGGQYKDARGLILSGDFSLPRTEDAWNNYQIQNKYFQQIFDRGTQNLDTNHKYDMIENVVGLPFSTLSGGLQGAAAGGMMGGAPGAIAGAAVGGAASLAGGVADIVLGEQRFNEAKDYRHDLFQLNNKTIQALPDTLVKGSGWNIDSTYVPFVELYECTAEERAAVVNKLQWNGYTVGRIGTFNAYVNPDDETYVKGQIIRIENVPDDFHYVNEISNEMYKGVFIPTNT